MTGGKQEQRRRIALVGETLRQGVETPTDTYITDDIPLLLTRLGQIPAAPPTPRRGTTPSSKD
jgi:hypothetical protein